MKLLEVEPNINYPISHYISEGGRWEIGIRPVLFGYRVCAGPTDRPIYSIDYCAGNDVLFLAQLYATIFKLIEYLPKDITINEFESMLPSYKVKPINLDPCWENLKQLVHKLQFE